MLLPPTQQNLLSLVGEGFLHDSAWFGRKSKTNFILKSNFWPHTNWMKACCQFRIQAVSTRKLRRSRVIRGFFICKFAFLRLEIWSFYSEHLPNLTTSSGLVADNVSSGHKKMEPITNTKRTLVYKLTHEILAKTHAKIEFVNRAVFLNSIRFSKQNVTTFHHFNPELFPSPTLILSALQNPSS